MNELDKEIQLQKVEPNSWRAEGYNSGFFCGAQFILSKNLPVLFERFLRCHFKNIQDDTYRCFDNDGIEDLFEESQGVTNGIGYYELKDIHEVWINNIYGK